MQRRLRFFACTTSLAALYLSIYAKNSHKEGDIALFIIENFEMKPSQREMVFCSVKHHAYTQVCAMSTNITEATQQVPTARKQLIRSLKTRPGFKQVYD